MSTFRNSVNTWLYVSSTIFAMSYVNFSEHVWRVALSRKFHATLRAKRCGRNFWRTEGDLSPESWDSWSVHLSSRIWIFTYYEDALYITFHPSWLICISMDTISGFFSSHHKYTSACDNSIKPGRRQEPRRKSALVSFHFLRAPRDSAPLLFRGCGAFFCTINLSSPYVSSRASGAKPDQLVHLSTAPFISVA